jgi:hypothetical protein
MSVVVRISERRAAIRVDVAIRAYLTELSDCGVLAFDGELLMPMCGEICNVSTTGVLVRAEEPVCPGRVVAVAFRRNKVRFELRGRVVRVEHLREGGAFLGLRLLNLPQHETAFLEEVVAANRPDPFLN